MDFLTFAPQRKSILKTQIVQEISVEVRYDQAGNKIEKGGNHRISFDLTSRELPQSIINQENQHSNNFSESDSESIDFQEHQNQLKEIKQFSKQTAVNEDSHCCIIF